MDKNNNETINIPSTWEASLSPILFKGFIPKKLIMNAREYANYNVPS